MYFSDMSLSSLPSGRGAGGHIIFMAPGDFACQMLWRSKTVKQVVRSTLAKGINTMVDAFNTNYLSRVMSEINSKEFSGTKYSN